MDMYPEDHPNKPHWRPGESTIIWPNGATAICISAESGEGSPRGLNTELIFADEMASYEGNEGIIHQAMLTLRHAPSKIVIATTPKSSPLLIEMVQKAKEGDPTIKLYSGSTYDNAANLSGGFMDSIVSTYEGTSLAAAELRGELILENAEALISMEVINRNLIKESEVPWGKITEVSLGLDPAQLSKKSGVSGKRTPDRTGMIVTAIDDDGICYVVDSFTGSYTSEGWAKKTAEIADSYMDRGVKITIVPEINTLGEQNLSMIYRAIDRPDLDKITKPTFSTESKIQRAAPYALMMQQDRVKLVDKKAISGLISDLTSYTGKGKYSPDFLDAWTQSMLVLKPKKKSFTKSFEMLL